MSDTETVWIRTASKGCSVTSYHTDPDSCGPAQSASGLREVPLERAERRGLTECSVCSGEKPRTHVRGDKYTRLLEGAAVEGEE